MVISRITLAAAITAALIVGALFGSGLRSTAQAGDHQAADIHQLKLDVAAMKRQLRTVAADAHAARTAAFQGCLMTRSIGSAQGVAVSDHDCVTP